MQMQEQLQYLDELKNELNGIYIAVKNQNPKLAKKTMITHLDHFEDHFKDKLINFIEKK